MRPLLVLLGALVLGCEGEPPLDYGPLRLRVVGENYEWHVRYPGADAILDTEDDVFTTRNLRLPPHTPIEIELESGDYLYGFRIPDYDVNKVAVPDIPFTANFLTRGPDVHVLKGDQLCGYAHERLLGQVIVEPRRDFQRWQQAQRKS